MSAPAGGSSEKAGLWWEFLSASVLVVVGVLLLSPAILCYVWYRYLSNAAQRNTVREAIIALSFRTIRAEQQRLAESEAVQNAQRAAELRRDADSTLVLHREHDVDQ